MALKTVAKIILMIIIETVKISTIVWNKVKRPVKRESVWVGLSNDKQRLEIIRMPLIEEGILAKWCRCDF